MLPAYPLEFALKYDPKFALYLLNEENVEINVKRIYYNSIVHFFIQYIAGNTLDDDCDKILKTLVARGANINEIALNEKTPLAEYINQKN